MSEPLQIGTGTIENARLELTEYKEMIENIVYAGIGTPVYFEITGPTTLNPQREIGSERTTLRTHTPSQRVILGIIIPTQKNTVDNCEYVILGIDRSAILIHNKAVSQSSYLFRELEPEGNGIKIYEYKEGIQLISLTAFEKVDTSFRIIATSDHSPDELVLKTEQALKLAKESWEDRQTNRTQAFAQILPKIRGLSDKLYPPSPIK